MSQTDTNKTVQAGFKRTGRLVDVSFRQFSDDLFNQKRRLRKYFKRFSVLRVAVYSQGNKNRRFPRGAKAVVTSYIDLIFPSSPKQITSVYITLRWQQALTFSSFL